MFKYIKSKIGRYKVVFILSSGQKMTVKCSSFTGTKLTSSKGSRTLELKGADRMWSVDLDEMVGYTAKWVLF